MSDPLVDNYLTRLEAAASVLPVDRRAELVQEISAHITEARAAGQAPDEASLRGVLDRLGDPEDIVAAAREPGSEASTDGGGMITVPSLPPAATRPSPWGALEVAAVLMLAIGGFFIPLVSPLVGLFCAWLSPKWTRAEKWVVTAIVGGAVIGPILLRGVLNTFFGEYGVRFDVLSGGTFAWEVLYWGGGAVAGIFLAMRLGNRD